MKKKKLSAALLGAFMASAASVAPAAAQDAQPGLLDMIFNGARAQPAQSAPPKDGARFTRKKVDLQSLKSELAAEGFRLGMPVHLRAYKQDSIRSDNAIDGALEVWMQRERGGAFAKFRTYKIYALSGGLGPKRKFADMQGVEGFYNITAGQLNPNSGYTLAMNTGYPNAYDRAHGGTGSAVMIHGKSNTENVNASAGCMAIGDDILAVYEIVKSAIANGQSSVPLHSFPFRMTAANMAVHAGHPAMNFWKNELLPGYRAFQNGEVPSINVRSARYIVGPVAPDAAPTMVAKVEPKAKPVQAPAVMLDMPLPPALPVVSAIKAPLPPEANMRVKTLRVTPNPATPIQDAPKPAETVKASFNERFMGAKMPLPPEDPAFITGRKTDRYKPTVKSP